MIHIFNNKKECVDGYYYNNYYDKTIIDGQTVKIIFQEDWSNKGLYYNIYFVIMNKRKSEHFTCLKCTGNIGLKGLIWAKKKIIEFENFIKEEKQNYKIIIYCHWDDNRRRDVYEYGLKKIGYKFGMIFGNKGLYKTI